jgi:hypothetical protein
MARSHWGLLGLGLAVLSCGGDAGTGHVEISGKSPDEAGATAARAVCAHEAQCGSVSIICSGGGSAGSDGGDADDAGDARSFICTARIEPIAYDSCYTDVSTSVARLLTCGALTPDQTNTLETCFDMLDARACTTQGEADARARANESGGASEGPSLPPECALLSMRPPGCT